MKRKLIAVASITVLICVVLGNIVACTEESLPPPEIITIIPNVPDTSQNSTSPTVTLNTTIPNNFCAPMAMVNILEYWDDVMPHANAQNVTAGLIPETAAEYLGYFMDTNNNGSPDRGNGKDRHKGTYANNISPGAWEFVSWNITNKFTTPPPFLPTGKNGYNWTVFDDYFVGFDVYRAEIDAGRPLVVCFRHWNLIPIEMNFTDPGTNETIDAFRWGKQTGSPLDPEAPEEDWNLNSDEEKCIGHAVTGVGYILDWDPWCVGGVVNWVIVHDNWDTTPRNVAIPWATWTEGGIPAWNSNHAVNPGPGGVPPIIEP